MAYLTSLALAAALLTGLWGFGGSTGGMTGSMQALFFLFLAISGGLLALRMTSDVRKDRSR